MSGGKSACKPGSNPKDIKRHERRRQKMRRHSCTAGSTAFDIHSMVENATSKALGELREGDVITEEMVAQLEVRLRSALLNVADEVAQVARKIVVPNVSR